MTRKHFAIVGMAGLVFIEIAMGLFSQANTVPAWLLTATLVFVLTAGSVLQATLLKFTLEHRRRNNWRQYASMTMQFTLFVLIAYWAHKGLGNTIFPGWSEVQLWLAGLGLGLITTFGPEVINEDYEDPENLDRAEKDENKPQRGVEMEIGTLAYQTTIKPLQDAKNGHNVDLEKAADLIN